MIIIISSWSNSPNSETQAESFFKEHMQTWILCKLKLPHLAQSENDMLLQSLTWVCVSHAGRFLQSVRDELVPRSQHVKYVKKAPENWPNYRVPLYLLIYKLRFREWQGESRLTGRFSKLDGDSNRALVHTLFCPLCFLLYCSSESSESLLNWRLPVYAPAGQWRLIPERKQSIAFRLCRHRRKGGEVSNM